MNRFMAMLLTICMMAYGITAIAQEPSDEGQAAKGNTEEQENLAMQLEGQGVPIATFYMRYAWLIQELQLEWKVEPCLEYDFRDYSDGQGLANYDFQSLRIFFIYPSMEIVSVAYTPTFDEVEERQLRACAIGYALRDDYWTDEGFDMSRFIRFYEHEYEAAQNAPTIRQAIPWGDAYSAHVFEDTENEDYSNTIQFVLTDYIRSKWGD